MVSIAGLAWKGVPRAREVKEGWERRGRVSRKYGRLASKVGMQAGSVLA